MDRRVDNCCFFFDLKTGGKIIAVVSLLLGISGFLNGVIDLTNNHPVAGCVIQIVGSIFAVVASVYLFLGIQKVNTFY